jgi:hypothetical protein
MLKALVLKELRELAPFAALALVAYAALVLYSIGYSIPFIGAVGQEYPFLSDDFVVPLGFIAAGLALALALRQTVAESLLGTWAWLLHRPLPRHSIFAAKLLTGWGLYAVCTALPIVWYACWAATPGKSAVPFFWSMTLDAWQVWFTVGAAYPACFLAGIWPGHWFGTRLLVLAGAGIILFVFALAPFGSDWWVLAWIFPPLFASLLVLSVFSIVWLRDFS